MPTHSLSRVKQGSQSESFPSQVLRKETPGKMDEVVLVEQDWGSW